MLPYEDENTEYKQEYVDDIRKEVIGFANAKGGTLYIGVRKDRTVIGVEDPDVTMVRTANMLKDAIAPDIMPFIKIHLIEADAHQIIQIEVSEGTNRPYYIREKGLKPSGVYIRKGSSSQPVSEEGIREMIVETYGKAYEKCRSLRQDLTFSVLKEEMEKRSLPFGNAQMRTLKLIGGDGLYTNLALLLSDQCEATIKVAVFQGTDKAVFRDRMEFSGSLLRQLEEAYHSIDLLNRTKAEFHGLTRTDIRDYPEEAVREALLNAIVHRDYSFSASTIVNIYEDKIEFVSLGGLVPGLALESIYLGVSQSRNPALAALFYRLHLIESFGTGISKIVWAYADSEKKPVFETSKGAFRVTLPNRAEMKEAASVKITDSAAMVLQYAKKHGGITRREAEMLLGCGQTKATNLLQKLCAEALLEKTGAGNQVRYIMKPSANLPES